MSNVNHIMAGIEKGAVAAGATQNTQEKKARRTVPWPGIKKASNWAKKDVKKPDPVLSNVVDVGCKLEVVGSSKARKSFFLLQLAILLAAGVSPFLKFEIPKPRKVLLVQMEIPDGHFHGRLVKMLGSLRIEPDKLEDRLHVLNGRGLDGLLDNPELEECLTTGKYEVVIFDPLYKLLEGDENLAKDVKPTLHEFDWICQEYGCAVIFSHHNPKGNAGDKNAIDRGAGSGVIARDYDAALYLTAHEQVDEGLLVCDSRLRCYPPQEPFSIRWMQTGHFEVDQAPPAVQTSSSSRSQAQKDPVTDDQALSIVAGGPLPMSVFETKLAKLATQRGAKPKREEMVFSGTLEVYKEKKQHAPVMIGTPEQISELQRADEAKLDSESKTKHA